MKNRTSAKLFAAILLTVGLNAGCADNPKKDDASAASNASPEATAAITDAADAIKMAKANNWIWRDTEQFLKEAQAAADAGAAPPPDGLLLAAVVLTTSLISSPGLSVAFLPVRNRPVPARNFRAFHCSGLWLAVMMTPPTALLSWTATSVVGVVAMPMGFAPP